MEEIKKIYFKYRNEAIESKMETNAYKDLLKTLLSYISFGEKTKLEISPMNNELFKLFKALKNDLNLTTITLNEDLFFKNKTENELIALKNKINIKLNKKR